MPRFVNPRVRAVYKTLAWTNLICMTAGAALPAFSQQPQQPQQPPQQQPGGGQLGQKPGQTPNPPGAGQIPIGTGGNTGNTGQTGPGTLNNGQNNPATPNQPVDQSLAPKSPLQRNDYLIDYRGLADPTQQRLRRTANPDLPLYGYNFFEPARQAITAYRYRFQQLLGPNYPGTGQSNQTTQYNGQAAGQTIGANNGQNNGFGNNPSSSPNGPGNPPNIGPSSAPGVNPPAGTGSGVNSGMGAAGAGALGTGGASGGLNLQGGAAGAQTGGGTRLSLRDQYAALASLSAAQLADLKARAAQGQLTQDEQTKFGGLIASGVLTQSSVLNLQQDDLSSTLTDSQKLNLMLRKRDNLLTDDEKARYRKFLYGSSGADTSSQGDQGNSAYQQFNPQPTFTQAQQPFDTGVPRSQLGQDFNLQNGGAKNARSEVAGPLDLLWQNITASVPTNYQISAGDKVTYRYASPTMEARELQIEVDPTGGLTVPDIGRVSVAGKTLAQAEADLRNRLQRYYRGATVSLSILELRTIQVTVTGRSFAPGTYVVPAVATAFNMLYATGGPTDDGSMRDIQVRRRGKLAGTIDFYKFLLTGDKTAVDVPLESGDVIYIPGRESKVTVTGEVREPAIYEVARNENLRDTLDFAGGVKATGVSQRVQVTTVQPGAARLTKDVNVTDGATASKTPLFDGDIVEVFSVRDELTNVVTVDGAVDVPGQYAVTPGMKVADLIQRSRGLIVDAYPNLAHLYRWNPDNTLTVVPINLEKAMAGDPKENVAIERWDRLTVYARQEITWTGRRDVTVRGAVKKPGIYLRKDNMRISDLMMEVGGTDPAAYMERAYLLHQKADGTFGYDIVDLNRAMKQDPKNDVMIQDHDILAVYRADEANFMPDHTTVVHGEVNSPGAYPRGEGMKLSELVGVAGGLTPRAGKTIRLAHARRPEGEKALEVTVAQDGRSMSPDPLLQDGDVVTVQSQSLIEKPGVITITGAVNQPGPVILDGPNVHLSDIVKLAGGLKPEAFPEGIEFSRNTDTLATTQQRQLMEALNNLNNILNQQDYLRALAAADVEKAKAIKEVSSSNQTISIPGFGSAPSVGPDTSLSAAAKDLQGRELVSRPRILTLDDLAPKGNVAVDLAAAMKHPGSDNDILMLDGDTINVPVRPTTVQVIGAVQESRGVLFQDGADLQYYIDHAGYYTRDAAKDRILVIRLGGGLLPVNKVKKFLPGDVIMVPTKPVAESIARRNNQVDSIFRSLTNSALIVLVAKKLLGL